MSGRRIPIGALVGAGGALLLVVSLFLDWYGDVSAFTSFEVLDLVLAGLGLGVLLALAEPLGLGARLPGPSPVVLGVAAVAIVVSQLINEPPAVVNFRLELGAWLGLAGALLMVVGSLPEVARVSLALDVEQRGSAAADSEAPTVEHEEPRP